MEDKTKKRDLWQRRSPTSRKEDRRFAKHAFQSQEILIRGHLRERAARAHREALKVPEDVREPLDGRKLQQSGAPASDFLRRCTS